MIPSPARGFYEGKTDSYFFLRAAAAPFLPSAVRVFAGSLEIVFFFAAAFAAFLTLVRAAARCFGEVIREDNPAMLCRNFCAATFQNDECGGRSLRGALPISPGQRFAAPSAASASAVEASAQRIAVRSSPPSIAK